MKTSKPARFANSHLRKAIENQKFVMYSAWITAGIVLITILMPSIWGPLGFLYDPVSKLILLALVASIGFVAWHMYFGALEARGAGYALIHVSLLIALLPLFLVGAFAIPLLVNGDAMRDQRSDAEQLVRDSQIKS